jgi:hypothetical protein
VNDYAPSFGEDEFQRFDRFVQEHIKPAIRRLDGSGAPRRAAGPVAVRLERSNAVKKNNMHNHARSSLPLPFGSEVTGANATMASPMASLRFGKQTTAFTFISSTELDYCAGLYYDPATYGRYS